MKKAGCFGAVRIELRPSDHDGCLFTVTVHRHEGVAAKLVVEKTSGKILATVRENARITIPELATLLGIAERSVERNMQKLPNEGHLRRIGAAKGSLGGFGVTELVGRFCR